VFAFICSMPVFCYTRNGWLNFVEWFSSSFFSVEACVGHPQFIFSKVWLLKISRIRVDYSFKNLHSDSWTRWIFFCLFSTHPNCENISSHSSDVKSLVYFRMQCRSEQVHVHHRKFWFSLLIAF
jgi:hypothetical protein